jgi:ATP-dependent RNA helicase DDX54/DBP10
MAKVASNGYKMYLKSRTGASVESVKRARKLKAASIGVHPITVRESTEVEEERADFLEQMKNFRPVNVSFERYDSVHAFRGASPLAHSSK